MALSIKTLPLNVGKSSRLPKTKLVSSKKTCLHSTNFGWMVQPNLYMNLAGITVVESEPGRLRVTCFSDVSQIQNGLK